MISLYLDDCLQGRRLVRPLRAAGHLLYLPNELGVTGQDDELHLFAATERNSVLVTHNVDDFPDLHKKWQSEGREHAGILVVRQNDYIGKKLEGIERAARLLTPDAAHNQLMPYQMFTTEEQGRGFVVGLIPLS